MSTAAWTRRLTLWLTPLLASVATGAAPLATIDGVPVAMGGFPDVPPLARPVPAARALAPRPSGHALARVGERATSMHSQREGLEGLSGRARTDPAYLADLVRIKAFLAEADHSRLADLEMPPLPGTSVRTLGDEYRILGQTLAYYRLARRIADTSGDPFGMSRLYLDLAFIRVRTDRHIEILLAVAQGAAIYEAFRQVVMFRVTGGALDRKAILAQRAMASLIRRLARVRGCWYSTGRMGGHRAQGEPGMARRDGPRP